MWYDKARDKEGIKVFEEYENLDRNIFSQLRKIIIITINLYGAYILRSPSLEAQQNITREHKLTLVNEQCRMDIMFSKRTIYYWNKLYTECVNASSVNLLKIKLTNISEGRVTHR